MTWKRTLGEDGVGRLDIPELQLSTMAKLTVTALRKQIAALEAKAAKLTHAEMKNSVAKVRALMDSLGVTMEHLGARVSKAVGTTKRSAAGASSTAKKRSPKRAGAGVAKYADPKTGKTWTGFGRAPTWLASVKNRDKFLIVAAEAVSPDAEPPAPRKTGKPARAPTNTPVKTGRKSVALSKAQRPAAKKVSGTRAKTTKSPRQAKAAEAKPSEAAVALPTTAE